MFCFPKLKTDGQRGNRVISSYCMILDVKIGIVFFRYVMFISSYYTSIIDIIFYFLAPVLDRLIHIADGMVPLVYASMISATISSHLVTTLSSSCARRQNPTPYQ